MIFSVIIIGAGGHASVVADALLAAGHHVIGFTDMNPALHGSTVCGLPVLGSDHVLAGQDPNAVWLANGMGSVRTEPLAPRRRAQQALQAAGWRFCPVVHPRACVSRFATLGDAVQVMAASVVQAGATLGAGTIVNTAAVVEHHAVLGDWSHIAPGAVVCADTRLGPHSHVGAGATVRQGLQLGAHTLVAAGAVVVRNFSGSGTLAGVPAITLQTPT